jgi:hypothetical protein
MSLFEEGFLFFLPAFAIEADLSYRSDSTGSWCNLIFAQTDSFETQDLPLSQFDAS